MHHPNVRLIVGLGNPGAEYAQTRHNAGMWFVEALCEMTHVTLKQEGKFQGAHGVASFEGHEVHLFLPSTFMNHSGRAVRALTQFYKIPPGAMLVAHDELDLPVGDVRLKWDGGAGGHNGLTDIIEQLGTKQFHRLRIGIGRPAHSDQVSDFVLKKPRHEERVCIDQSLSKACDIMPLILSGHFQKAMNQLHGNPKSSSPAKREKGEGQ